MSAKSIMVVGTMSSSGKSFITAGLCRIFMKDGKKTVPFKSQNMALNSYITKAGLEMGRAQVMQAEAARVEPDVRMNPILLKPTSDMGSQVIVNGEVLGTMNAVEYYKRKKEMIPYIKEAYNSLAEENDIIVLEGAGSPAEINLKDVDIVNMGMAEISDSPVILVGDIDRGGVFASVYGTIALMNESERRRIKGIIINKFRGDVEILKSGLVMLEELTGVPVLGVVPYADIDLDDEDSLSEKLSRHQMKKDAIVDIAVIRVPRISNFTDFDAISRIDGVSVRYVTKVEELGNPDIIFLPGTKNTMADLRWMRQNGLEASVIRHNNDGCPVFGICGGYQMLGNTLSDPDGVEDGGSMRGMGLLDIDTVFMPEKHRTRVSGVICDTDNIFNTMSGQTVEGYEIHMGQSEGGANAVEFVRLDDGSVIGYTDREKCVCGTYLHGIFDSGKAAEMLVKAILNKKGITAETVGFDTAAYKEKQYDKLESLLRENLDMDKIYEITYGWEKEI